MKRVGPPSASFLLRVAASVALSCVPLPALATTADDICALSADPCEVLDKLTITDLSVLDFGARTLIIRQGGRLDVGAGQMTIRAGKLTVDSGGSLRGQPTGTIDITIDGKGTNDGAVLLNGDIQVDGGTGGFAGTLNLQAGGSVELRGGSEIDASGNSSVTDGGEVSITSGGDIVIDGKSLGPSVQAKGGADAAGGLITLLADGSVQVLEKVSADGGSLDGGEIDIEVKGDIDVGAKLTADGSNGWGFGGLITLIGDGDIFLDANIRASGAPGSVENGSGDGGEIMVFAGGTLAVNGDVLAQAGADGDGGDIDITSMGDLVVSRVISVDGGGSEAAGGDISIDGKGVTITDKVTSSGGRGGGGFIDIFAFDDLNSGAVIAANGGAGGINESGDGGDIFIDVGDDLVISANIQARGSGLDGFGGFIDMGVGVLSAGGRFRHISGTLKASGNDSGGGFGGLVDVLACVVEQSLGASIEAKGNAGVVNLASREAMTIAGAVTADAATGSITLIYRTGSTLPLIVPSASLSPFDPGTDEIANPQLTPCPLCGNGVVEAPEECDDGGQIAGDGCDENCRLECGNRRPDPGEACDDGNRLDGDCCSATCSFESAGGSCTSDGNQCTLDQCDGAGTCLHVNDDGAACDNGLFCDGTDTCLGGFCSQHSGSPCPATECNTCQEVPNSCFDPLGTACTDDGNECTVDRCDGGGSCTHPAQPAGVGCTDDGNVCTDDRCDGAGQCAHPANASPCDDGIFCNGQDACQAGGCGVHAGDPCAGGAECSASCDEAQDTCFEAAGTLCTDDGNVCTDDICDGTGVCSHPPNTASCDDADACTTVDSCNGGACVGGPPLDCDDGNPCTDDTCVPATGCVNAANSAPCDDGIFCNGQDSCQAGGCGAHAGDPCAGGAECSASCDEAQDTCFDAAGALCTDDGNVCTDDVCDGTGTCSHPPNTASCDDGDLCTPTDQCDGAGACVGSGSTCGNGSVEGTCGEECDDGGNAAGDGCDPECVAEVCGNGKVQADEECDDGNAVSGDGCSPACSQDVPLPLVPGRGSSRKDCVMAWGMDPVPPLVKGFPTEKVSCRENDPACDFDTDRFQCTFHVWICVNQTLPGKDCTAPDSTESFLLKKPRPDRPKDSADTANAAVLEGAMRDLGIDILRKKTVIFDGPGVSAPDVCTRRLDIVVPITPGRTVGKRLVKGRAVGQGGGKLIKDSDKLKLTCFR